MFREKKSDKFFRDPSLLLSFALFLKIYRIINFFWKNWLVNEFWTAMGGGLLGVSKQIIFIFKMRQKMVTKLGQFTKLGPFSTLKLFKLSKLCYHFLSSFENWNNFFDISSNPPPIAVWNSLTNNFFQKKLTIL